METQNGRLPTRRVGLELPRAGIEGSGAADIVGSLGGIAAASPNGSPLLEISNAMVGLYKEAFGRGPTKARTQFAGHDTLLVTLESTLTVAERNLVAMGEHRRLRAARVFLSDALEDRMRAIVEQAVGRKTLAFVSAIDTARDVTIKLFTLEPAGEGADARRSLGDRLHRSHSAPSRSESAAPT